MTDESGSDFGESLSGARALQETMADLEARSQRFGSALTGALRQATAGGKGLDDVLKGLGSRLSDIALSAGLKPLQSLLGKTVESALGSIGSVTAFADGGVVRAPTYFSAGSGTGLMGEAGAEAILPLQRGADGSLGVSVSGGAQAQPQIVFNVTATDAASFRKSEGQITTMLARSVARGRRGL